MGELISERIRRNARELKLYGLAETADELVDRAEVGKLGYREFLDLVLESEVGVLEGRRNSSRVKLSGLPHHKTLDEFDASFQPELDPKRLAELRSLRFVQNKVSSLILGPSDHLSHCPPRCRHWSNSPAPSPDTLILRPFRRPLVTWTASSSPRWTLCKTVWRAHPSRWAASPRGR